MEALANAKAVGARVRPSGPTAHPRGPSRRALYLVALGAAAILAAALIGASLIGGRSASGSSDRSAGAIAAPVAGGLAERTVEARRVRRHAMPLLRAVVD
jgi:hypothetical protein